MNVSPTGKGLLAATVFTFTAVGVSDPDGDPLVYSWQSSDGTVVSSTTQAASHVYQKTGVFTMSVTATDPAGLIASASTTVSVGDVTGTWDTTCIVPLTILQYYPNFPTHLVVSLFQEGVYLGGSMSANGLTHNFTDNGLVSDSRGATWGVESFDNVWAPHDSDFYFRMVANDTLTTMSGSGQYCQSSTATRR